MRCGVRSIPFWIRYTEVLPMCSIGSNTLGISLHLSAKLCDIYVVLKHIQWQMYEVRSNEISWLLCVTIA